MKFFIKFDGENKYSDWNTELGPFFRYMVDIRCAATYPNSDWSSPDCRLYCSVSPQENLIYKRSPAYKPLMELLTQVNENTYELEAYLPSITEDNTLKYTKKVYIPAGSPIISMYLCNQNFIPLIMPTLVEALILQLSPRPGASAKSVENNIFIFGKKVLGAEIITKDEHVHVCASLIMKHSDYEGIFVGPALDRLLGILDINPQFSVKKYFEDVQNILKEKIGL